LAATALEKIPLTTLRLIIPTTWDANQDSCEWAILDRQGKTLRRGRDLLAGLPQCDETEVVVPAAMVGFISAQLPPGSHRKVLSALPFLVEAGLISAPEDTHAVLAAQTDDQVLVAVIQKAWVSRLMDRLARAEIFPTRMFPETLLPELPQDGWAMVCRGHESFIRTGYAQGIPLDIDSNSGTIPFVLALALKQSEASQLPNKISLYGEMLAHESVWETQLGIPLVRATQQEWFVNDSKPTVNLLQGEFQPSGGISRRLAAFKPVAVTLACLLVLQISFSMLDYAFKTNDNRKLDQAMVTQFKASFPNANVVDAPLQMQRNLEELKHGVGQSGNTDFIPLLAAVTTSIGAISTERLKGMDYQSGKLILNLLMPDMEQAQAMRQRLSASGLSATIDNSHQSPQGLELQLVISASAS
jgi:general secretion pathway protein L